VRSDIRVAIDAAFRDAEIVIAFPQRDVHLDVQSPIEVSLSDARPASGRATVRRAA
jgi:potassium efflux system protein